MEEILREGFTRLGLALPPDTERRFLLYSRLLTERNRVHNLTAITDEADIARLHFLDCAAVLPFIPNREAEVVDVGAGAGFPGLVLKLLEPRLRMTLLDSQKKRVDFLREACSQLGLTDVACLHARAEEAAPLRGSFDIAVSRAVARLNVLCELCLPLVRPGGLFLAMKGPDCLGEVREAGRAIEALGGLPGEIERYAIPGTDIIHSVVRVRKHAPTPSMYPRRFAKIQKQPL